MSDENLTAILFTPQGRKVGIAVAALMGLFAVWALISAIAAWVPGKSPVRAALSKVPVAKTLSPSAIPNWHLFGDALAAGALPKTNLALILQGLMKSTGSQASTAIVSAPGIPGKVYSVGDTLPGGAILYKILKNAIVLKVGGQLQELPLVRPQLHFQGPPARLQMSE